MPAEIPTDQALAPIRLHDFALSGHCHRVRLFLSLLGLPVELLPMDLAGGAQKRPGFLAMNAFGEVPVIEDPNGVDPNGADPNGAGPNGADGEGAPPVVLPDSNAILVYLAGRYDPDGRWLPREPLAAARVQRWLSVAAGQLNYGPARARALALFGRPGDLAWARRIGGDLLQVMERELDASAFLAGEAPTVADVALYSYTAHAPEGGISLEPFPRVRAWLARIEALPGFVAMPRSPVPAQGD